MFYKAYSTHSDTIHILSYQTLGSYSKVTRKISKYSMNTYNIVDVKSLDLKRLKHNGFNTCHYLNNKRIQFALAVYEYLHFL
jgi:hypothetical protein